MESPSPMASSPTTDVEEEVKCPICKEYLSDPVTLDCGHNFCRGCITDYCEKWEDLGDLECPLCKAKIKRGNFRPNWQLANVVEKIKCLSFNLGKENLCARHQEKLHLFCKEDQELVCIICERSPEHRSHPVLLLEEAAKECKDQLCGHLEDLRKERERILASQAGTEKESQDLLGQVEEKKTSTVAVFNRLHQFLEKQKMPLLSQLEELEKEIATRREEHMARLKKELSSLEGLIQQMEEKCQQPASELLQDIRMTLQRAMESEGLFKEQANVTLDPDTVHPRLVLSEDRRSVRWGYRCQDLPNNPERFDYWEFVLGREGFTAGRHFWEVTVGDEGAWAVGVARKSVSRKGWFFVNPEKGFWAVGQFGGQYRVVNPPAFTLLSLSQELKRIQVTLNCTKGEVDFSDADTGVHIHTYSGNSFCGETLLPFFYVDGNAHLRLSL
ncbi:tripartite motif-containing protein 10-like [Tiliqua scincoides]|uniref:tripartite motif-containing protein 10-like n=1 Tax=Tiliqua scincoides TaxID=71010 RepID=UPI003463493B